MSEEPTQVREREREKGRWCSVVKWWGRIDGGSGRNEEGGKRGFKLVASATSNCASQFAFFNPQEDK